MDFSKNTVLKENYAFLVADADAHVQAGEHGLYHRDTRFLSRYAWNLGGFRTLLAHSPRPDLFEAHYALVEGPSQLVGIRRTLELTSRTLQDTLVIENTGLEGRSLSLELALEGDFADLFEARGWREVTREGVDNQMGEEVRFSYEASDGLKMGAVLQFSRAPDVADDNAVTFNVELAAKERLELGVTVQVESPFEENAPLMSYEAWRSQFAVSAGKPEHQAALTQAVDDLRALLFSAECGPYPAAGIPWYVAAFGRDALLTAHLMLPRGEEVAKGTLRYLALHQGKTYDNFRAEAPGKIMHEVRFGELARTKQTPHSPYYGTVDATALFVTLLYEVWQQTGDFSLVEELRPNWEAALRWLQEDGDADGDAFVEFQGADAHEGSSGLAVQSWKDSHDSMSHADGSLARGTLAVSEVQGYTYAAYRAAAAFYNELGEDPSPYTEKADTLKTKFHKAFWLEDMQTYAMALDGGKRPLRVHNSDAGQLLWAGIVPEEVAPKLVKTLFSDENWSGWGIRTLGANEARYNPVSYHNGSVWPHDTALIAGGLARYGFSEEVAKIREATFDLAASQGDKRLPELVAGYGRVDAPPVPYPAACRPQAWDAAALLYLSRL